MVRKPSSSQVTNQMLHMAVTRGYGPKHKEVKQINNHASNSHPQEYLFSIYFIHNSPYITECIGWVKRSNPTYLLIKMKTPYCCSAFTKRQTPSASFFIVQLKVFFPWGVPTIISVTVALLSSIIISLFSNPSIVMF